MMDKLLNHEGPVIGVLHKTGLLIGLSVLWFLGCVPVVTVGTSTAALYYAVVKSVRRGQGNAFGEYWRSYRSNFLSGVAITITFAVIAGILFLNWRILQNRPNRLVTWGTLVGAVLIAFCGVYLPAVLSRFQIRIREMWMLSFVLSVRFVFYTVLLLVGTAAVCMLQLYVLPVPTILLLPGVGCWCASFLVEKALRSAMPEKEENDNAWYYET